MINYESEYDVVLKMKEEWSLVARGISKEEALTEMGIEEEDFPEHECFLCVYELQHEERFAPCSDDCADTCIFRNYWVEGMEHSHCNHGGAILTAWRKWGLATGDRKGYDFGTRNFDSEEAKNAALEMVALCDKWLRTIRIN